MALKKLVTAGLAMAMTIAVGVTAFAAEVTDPAKATGVVEANGSIEGYVDKDLFDVIVPSRATSIQFKMDPQELLKASGSTDKLDGTAFSAASGYGSKVLFQKEGSTTDWLTESSDILFTNRSSFDVDVNLTAQVTGNYKGGANGYDIKVVDTGAAGFDSTRTDTYIALKITPSTGTVTGNAPLASPVKQTAAAVTNDVSSATVTQKVAAAPSTLFEIVKQSGTYEFRINSSKESTTACPSVKFNLSGTVNTKADWTNYNKDTASALKVGIVYEIKKHIDPPTVTFTSAGLITVSGLVPGKAFSAMTITDGSLTVPNAHTDSNLQFDATNYDVATNTGSFTAQLGPAYKSWGSGKDVTVTIILSDGTSVKATTRMAIF